jgi:hypothetical protein
MLIRGVPVTDNIRQKFGYWFGYRISEPIRIFVRIRFGYPNDSDIQIISDNIGYRISDIGYCFCCASSTRSIHLDTKWLSNNLNSRSNVFVWSSLSDNLKVTCFISNNGYDPHLDGRISFHHDVQNLPHALV